VPEHQVEQYQVRVVPPEGVDRLAPIRGLDDRKALLLETLRERFAQRSFVVDDKDRSSHPGFPSYGAAAAWASSLPIARSSRASVRS